MCIYISQKFLLFLIKNARKKLLRSTQRFADRNVNEANKLKVDANPANSGFIPPASIEQIQSHGTLWSTPAIMTNGLIQHNRKTPDFQHPQIMVIYCNFHLLFVYHKLLDRLKHTAIYSLRLRDGHCLRYDEFHVGLEVSVAETFEVSIEESYRHLLLFLFHVSTKHTLN